MPRLKCECGYELIVAPDVTQALKCFRCTSSLSIRSKTCDVEKPQVLSASTQVNWDSLHRYGIVHSENWDPVRSNDWFKDWISRLPPTLSQIHRRIHFSQCVPDVTSAKEFFIWTVEKHNEYNRTIGARILGKAEAYSRYRFYKNRGRVQRLVTWNELTQDTLLLAQAILEQVPEVAGIAGCPRSGFRVAADIALRLDLPLYEASAENGLRRCSAGGRFQKSDIHGIRRRAVGTIVIVDDSACSGTSLRELKLDRELKSLPAYVVYADPASQGLVDGFAVDLPVPHWFEWNFFNNGQLLSLYNVGLDWDGVLNEDCPGECDDDGTHYRKWMEKLKPNRTPRGFRIPFIVSGRLEKYRKSCENWLRYYGIEVGTLVLFPGTFDDRAATDIGEWKAKTCHREGIGLFVESCPRQAQTIARLCDSIVLCADSSSNDDLTHKKWSLPNE